MAEQRERSPEHALNNTTEDEFTNYRKSDYDDQINQIDSNYDHKREFMMNQSIQVNDQQEPRLGQNDANRISFEQMLQNQEEKPQVHEKKSFLPEI